MEKIDNEQLLPTRYSVMPKRAFLFQLEGIDYFLVRSVHKSPWKRFFRKKELIVVLVNAIAPSTEQQVREIIKNNKGRKAELKLLDPVGHVVSKTRYEGVKLKKVEFDCNSYSENDYMLIRITLKYKKEIFEF